jgi:soluble lytic murein transglycosylase-like protein
VIRRGRLLEAAILLLSPIVAGSGAYPSLPDSRELPLGVAVAPAWGAPEDLARQVVAATAEAGIPAWILARVIEAESGWNVQAVGINPDGSRDLGIAQLGERWLADFSWFDNAGRPVDPFDPAQALPVAARYLARLYRATGDWRAAVAAYNCGLSRVRAGRIPQSTLRYVASIFEEGER